MRERPSLPTTKDEFATFLIDAVRYYRGEDPYYPVVNHPNGTIHRYFERTIEIRIHSYNRTQKMKKDHLQEPYDQRKVLMILELLITFSCMHNESAHHLLETGCSTWILQTLVEEVRSV